MPLHSKLLKVLCEACLRGSSRACTICNGLKFYFWDPSSQRCFLGSGVPMVAQNEFGELVEVVRHHPYNDDTKEISTGIQLAAIEKWVAADPVRSWKLSLNDDGWQACIWFNRFKKKCSEKIGKNFEECVMLSFEEIQASIGSHSNPESSPLGAKHPGTSRSSSKGTGKSSSRVTKNIKRPSPKV